MELYKVLNEDQTACMGVGAWPPVGEWFEVKGKLIPCNNGIHLCRRDDLIHWIGPAIFTVEYDGEMIESDNKIVVRRARLLSKLETWNERTARLLACDFAKHVLGLYEGEYPDDNRPRNCIEITRKVANGDLPVADLAAARAAALDAGGVVWAAGNARAAVAAAGAGWAATRDARDAARNAAGAARSAARAAVAAAEDARTEKKWQTETLFRYLMDTLGDMR